jgi:prevent-host-death family protein
MSVTASITRDTLDPMARVTIRELRNQGGDVVDRAASGEQITITRSGRPVAELRPLRPLRAPLSADSLLERWRRLPVVDPVALRDDVDELVGGDLDDLLDSIS